MISLHSDTNGKIYKSANSQADMGNMFNKIALMGTALSCFFLSCAPYHNLEQRQKEKEMQCNRLEDELSAQKENGAKICYVFDQGVVLKEVSALDVYWISHFKAYSEEGRACRHVDPLTKDTSISCQTVYSFNAESKVPGIIKKLGGADGIITQPDVDSLLSSIPFEQ